VSFMRWMSCILWILPESFSAGSKWLGHAEPELLDRDLS